MADAYWRYAADPRQHQQPPPPAGATPGAHLGGGMQQMAAPGGGGQQQPMKRARPADFSDVHGAPDMTGYYPRDEERAGYRAARDTEALNASYERFLRTGQLQSYGAVPAGEPIRPAAGGNAGYPVDDRPMMAARGMDNRNIGYGGGIPEQALPPDASNTLFIEGIPTGCTRREVSHIFRPFVGFREVRLVNKEPKHPGGDPIVLCFVDFAEPAQAAIALDALQGEVDELDIYRYFLNYVQLILSHTSVLPKVLLVSFSHIPIFLLLYGDNHDFDIYRYYLNYAQLILSHTSVLPKVLLVSFIHVPIFLLLYVDNHDSSVFWYWPYRHPFP